MMEKMYSREDVMEEMLRCFGKEYDNIEENMIIRCR